MPDDLSSPGGSATPTPAQPVTGTTTPAPGGATPPAVPNLTLEEAIKELTELRHKHFNATEELERHRKFRDKYDEQQKKAEAAKKAAEEAQLSEIERVKKQYGEAEQQIQRYKQELIAAQVRMAAQAKGIIDPDLAALAIQSSLEYGEDGMPTNVDKALDALLKNKPYLAPAPAEPPAQPAPTPAQAAPTIPAWNVSGRSQLAPPTVTPPGKPPRLADVHKRP